MFLPVHAEPKHGGHLAEGSADLRKYRLLLISFYAEMQERIPCNPFNMDTFPSPYIPVMINHYLCSALSIRWLRVSQYSENMKKNNNHHTVARVVSSEGGDI